MKIFATNQIKTIDQQTIDNEPIHSIDLMERASTAMFKWIKEHTTATIATVFVGTGNNGGDALAIARMMSINGWKVTVCLLQTNNLSPDCQINYKRILELGIIKLIVLANGDNFPTPVEGIVIDGILGSGINRVPEGKILQMIQHINKLELSVISIDMPSGMRGEDNSMVPRDAIVKATYTLSLGFPKLSFLFPSNDAFVGEWNVLDIGLNSFAIEQTATPWEYITATEACKLLPSRDKFSHKGIYGHALLIAGSYGMMGAAVLASKSCFKAGVGLLTTHVPSNGYNIIQTAVPEAIVSIDRSDILFSEYPELSAYNAIGVGPGIGIKTNTVDALSSLLDEIKNQPLVIDADGLNIISQHTELLLKLKPNTILTPHPKEFQRLSGTWYNDYQRLELLSNFSRKYGVIVVLKGAYTTIASPDGRLFFNSTGNPGMASAGSGDVLTGILLALLSQSISPLDAAILGVYLHGSAGDIYAASESEESLTSTDIVNSLGSAFRQLRTSMQCSSTH